MKSALPLAIALFATFGTLARAEAAGPLHPGVVRVIVPEDNGASLGSGALVALGGPYGLVVTNWHVVRDTQGRVEVAFPDGFRSSATLVKVDRDWDLAALVIWRPRAQAIPLASTPPTIGEPLAIAGYGRGEYRIVAGQCVGFVSPLGPFPPEMIRVSVGARNGDSGGPILNRRGELAGVLFGAAWGETTGSHCLRVREFLKPILRDFEALPNDPASNLNGPMLANRTPNASPAGPTTTPTAAIGANSARTAPAAPAYAGRPMTGSGVASSARQPSVASNQAVPRRSSGGWTADAPGAPANAAARDAMGLPPGGLSTRPTYDEPEDVLGQLKTFLAVVGLLALLFHGIRILGAK